MTFRNILVDGEGNIEFDDNEEEGDYSSEEEEEQGGYYDDRVVQEGEEEEYYSGEEDDEQEDDNRAYYEQQQQQTRQGSDHPSFAGDDDDDHNRPPLDHPDRHRTNEYNEEPHDGRRYDEEEEDVSYETDTQYDDDDDDYEDEDDEEPEEHDDIQSAMTPYSTEGHHHHEETRKRPAHPQQQQQQSSSSEVDIMQTPTREEVEQVRRNYANNFGYPQLEKDQRHQQQQQFAIPKKSQSSTTTTTSGSKSSSHRGRSPTPKGQPPPQYYPRPQSQLSSAHSSIVSVSSEKPLLQQTQQQQQQQQQQQHHKVEDAVDSIQATVGDATYSFGKKHREKIPLSSMLLQQQQQTSSSSLQEKPKSSTSLPISSDAQEDEEPQQHAMMSSSKPSSSKSAFALNGSYPTQQQQQPNETTPQQPPSTATQTPPVSPSMSKKKKVSSSNSLQKSPTATSNHSSLKRKSSHRKSNTIVMGAPRISWKSDPHDSFSDWTIQVLFEDEEVMDVYHVHRNIVGFGNRKSHFLLTEFRNQQEGLPTRKEEESAEAACISYMKLPPAHAQVFPMVLDYMYYTKEAKQTLTAERACNVFKLAETLEIPPLQKAIADFYTKNLSLKNLGEFLLAASKAKADRLLVVSKAKIGQMITEKPELSGLVPPKFMADILLISHRQLVEARSRSPEKYSEALVESQSRYWSKAACICAAHNESVLTARLFEELTSEEALPHIDFAVAPKLLMMEAKFSSTQKNGDAGATAPSSLQRRCIESLTNDFHHFQQGFATPKACSRVLRELPSDVLAEILMRTVNHS